jgi:uncharacterized RmlC-like cupin family protein
MGGGVRRIAPSDRTEGAGTPGMIREEAVATDGLWAGFVRTSPGMTSGWHHHGDYETAIFILSGALRMEFGPGGEATLDGRPGDFLYVPPNTIHRESNPTDTKSQIVVSRSGTGSPVFNVDGPEASGRGE